MIIHVCLSIDNTFIYDSPYIFSGKLNSNYLFFSNFKFNLRGPLVNKMLDLSYTLIFL